MTFILAVLILVNLVAGAKLWIWAQERERLITSQLATILRDRLPRTDLLLIKETMRNWAPELMIPRSSQDRAFFLRNLIHHEVPIGGGFKLQNDYFTSFETFCSSLHDDDARLLCGGRSHLYQFALEAFGVPSRIVNMRSDPANPDSPGHSTVEIYVEGRWIASDPTYNATLTHHGRHIGYQEVRELIKSGGYEDVIIDPIIENGQKAHETPDRPWEDIRVGLPKIVHYLQIQEAVVRDVKGTHTFPAVILPREWDGRIKMADAWVDFTRPGNTLSQRIALGLLR